jgi:predicted PurR-regulated permease PerM
MNAEGRPYSDAGTRFLVGAASFVIVVAGLRAAQQLVVPFLLAVFLAVVSVPFMRWLQSRRVPRLLAMLSTVLAAIGVIALLALVLGRSLNQFADVAPQYQARLQDLMDSVVGLLSGWGIPTDAWQSLDLLPVGLFDVLGGALGALASIASNTFLVLLAVIFILMEAAGFSAKLQAAFGSGAHFGPLARMTRQVQNYLVIKTAVSAATGTIVGLWVAALGLDFAVLWGLVAFLLNFVPNLGSIIAAVPAVLLALIQLGPGRAAVIAVGYVFVNIVFGNFVEPMLMGRRLGLSTLVVFTSLVFWGWVWGPVGMLFSVPLTMVVKIALENTQDFRWVSVMLEANPTVSAKAPASGPS